MAHSDLSEENSVAGNGAAAAATTILVSRRESFNAAHQLADPRPVRRGERAAVRQVRAPARSQLRARGRRRRPDRLSATGYVLDLKRLADIIERRIIRDVDHRNLNTDVPWLEGRIPTAENLALACWERIRAELPDGSLRSVRVWETDKNWAEVGDRG